MTFLNSPPYDYGHTTLVGDKGPVEVAKTYGKGLVIALSTGTGLCCLFIILFIIELNYIILN